MYHDILVLLDNSPTDEVILVHIRGLAKLCRSRLLLVHVADGFVARNREGLDLAESEEMRNDRAYLERVRNELADEGFQARDLLLCGDPTAEILKAVDREDCDLIAMATHGHGFLKDLLLGSVAEKLRHRTAVPILMVRG